MRSGMGLGPKGGRKGLGAPEVIVGLAVLLIVGLMLLTLMPRQREKARIVGCQQNLRDIGEALRQYSEATEILPSVPTLGGPGAATPSPLGALLVELDVRNFRGLDDPRTKPPGREGAPLVEISVPGFVCPSDPNASGGLFPAPISYRACTGDAPDGRNGAFAPGKVVSIAEVEAGDGLAFSAAFSERLVGDGRDDSQYPGNHAVVPGPIAEEAPAIPPDASWKGDAGSSWLAADWRSTLETHAIGPGAAPSTIAADGRSARMGASSGHADAVHVLFLDGSVRPYTTRIDLDVWKALANLDDGKLRASGPPPASGTGPGPPP